MSLRSERIAREILEHAKPKPKTRQVARIWDAVCLLKEEQLTYRQIAELLLPKLDMDMSYRQFLTACWAVRQKPPQRSHHRHSQQFPSGNYSRPEAKRNPATDGDPLESARQKLRDDRRGSEIIAGKA